MFLQLVHINEVFVVDDEDENYDVISEVSEDGTDDNISEVGKDVDGGEDENYDIMSEVGEDETGDNISEVGKYVDEEDENYAEVSEDETEDNISEVGSEFINEDVDLSENLNRYFEDADRYRLIDKEMQTEPTEPKSHEIAIQTNEPIIEEAQSGLLISGIPVSLNVMSKIAISMEKHGSVESIKVLLDLLVFFSSKLPTFACFQQFITIFQAK